MRLLFALALAVFSLAPVLRATDAAPVFGPAHFEARGGGPGHTAWFDGPPPTEPGVAWTLSAWVKPAAPITAPTLVAGIGSGLDMSGSQRFFAADATGWFFFVGAERLILCRNCFSKDGKDRPSSGDAFTPEQVNHGRLHTTRPAAPGQWTHLAATYDGKTLRAYLDGAPAAEQAIPLARAAMMLRVGPAPAWPGGASFTGRVAAFTAWDTALAPATITRLATATRPADLDRLAFTPAPAGPTPDDRDITKYLGRRSSLRPQNPKDLPSPRPAPPSLTRTPQSSPRPVPTPDATGQLVLDCGWQLTDATTLRLPGPTVSRPGFDTSTWLDATVPGTVLTTLVRQGLYPDPLYGLNNLLIPDDLARKSWWYRIEFPTPADWPPGRPVELLLNGVNYHAEPWLNGTPLPSVTGAFLRGRYDVAPRLAPPGRPNVLAIRVWPQPHNGIAHEESLRAGTGPNGADGTLDGPTFICTEGWDWIPTIRDRNTGLWQSVVLRPTPGDVLLNDPHVVTVLPRLPDLSLAEVTISAEVRNTAATPREVRLTGTLAGRPLPSSAPLTLAPGETRLVTLPVHRVENPALWWPNTYGAPTLHDLELRVTDLRDRPSDRLHRRVGLRTVSQKRIPHLVLEINGRRVFCKGGNWGLDDAMKDIPRARIEPWVRLHREANLTMIRNWVGQSTSRDFYELCDQYGLLVWNDFWLATGDHDLPASEATTFLANATDTVKRFRAHPSIVLWCARNEGNPPPWIAAPLEKLLTDLDGTRPYIPNSWEGSVQGGGPYRYTAPSEYFKVSKNKPFTTELGIDSVPTADALRAAMPAESLWPINDTWAYLDAHNADKADYYKAIAAHYGPATGFDDFVRRAQMVNYVNHRAMFEGWLSRLWNPASGVLLWMSHPARQSTVWQLYSHDTDTHAAYYAAKKACEPVHAQWSPLDDTLAVVNTRPTALPGATLTLRRLAFDGHELERRVIPLDVAPDSLTPAGKVLWGDPTPTPPASEIPNPKSQIPPSPPPAAPVVYGSTADASTIDATAPTAPADPARVQFLKLELHDAAGRLLSENFYWRSAKPEELLALDQLAPIALEATLNAAYTDPAGSVGPGSAPVPGVGLGVPPSPSAKPAVPATPATSAATAASSSEISNPKSEIASPRDAPAQPTDARVTLRLRNPGPTPALMAHAVLRDAATGARVLPAYWSDNYISLLPGETHELTAVVPAAALPPPARLQLTLDGWNIRPAMITPPEKQ